MAVVPLWKHQNDERLEIVKKSWIFDLAQNVQVEIDRARQYPALRQGYRGEEYAYGSAVAGRGLADRFFGENQRKPGGEYC